MSEEKYFVVYGWGDGSVAKVVPESKLKQELHDQMCSCKDGFENCATEGIKDDVDSLDVDDNWTHEYPTDERRKFSLDFEDGGIDVIALSEPPSPVLECARLSALLNTPELQDFAKAVVLEAAHQRERWGSDHDAGKTSEDWLWVIAYLATKAHQALRYEDKEKALHHLITTAAALANWHAQLLDACNMRPGLSEEKQAAIDVGASR